MERAIVTYALLRGAVKGIVDALLGRRAPIGLRFGSASDTNLYRLSARQIVTDGAIVERRPPGDDVTIYTDGEGYRRLHGPGGPIVGRTSRARKWRRS